MPFSSPFFLIVFLPGTMALYFLGGTGSKHRTYKNAVLLIASVLFYAWGEPVFVFVMLASVCVNYVTGLAIERFERYRKRILIASLIFNLGILLVFKYLTFILENLSRVAPVPTIQIALPIGISFYTFQIMSYIFDVYYRKTPAQRNPFWLALYITMFPQLIAGPIVRYQTVAAEIMDRRETGADFSAGISRFVAGLAKKVLIADFLGTAADSIFTAVQYTRVAPLTAWIGAIAYTYEIYYDFSGYSDMAIGLGKCLGFHFPENFRYPYQSTSISEFWHRWHLSLTTWFRDYVYIPLGGNRRGWRRQLFNLFIVWLLTGFWHGAEWTFVVWGLFHFCLQTLERKTGFQEKLPRGVAWCYTMLMVIFGFAVFRAPNLSVAGALFRNMFSIQAGLYNTESLSYAQNMVIVTLVAVLGSFPVLPTLRRQCEKGKRLKEAYEIFNAMLTVALLAVSLLVVINGSYSPFIYFNF